jgi:starch synthase (maltosyl-transferring)
VEANTGKSRAIIDNVSPQIDGGKYPIKRTVGEKVTVSADVITDGHDDVKAVVLYKKITDSEWSEAPMKVIGVDKWGGSFRITEQVLYLYTVKGWVDHFSTWQKGVKKKFDDGQNVTVELEIGARLIEKAAIKATPADSERMLRYAHSLRNHPQMEEAVSAAVSPEISLLYEIYADKPNATVYEQRLHINVEFKKAMFSTWYEFFPRSTSEVPYQHGTFKDCKRIMPHVAEMGFDVVYFPPIHPIGKLHRKGKNNTLNAKAGEPGSCWAIGATDGGHKAVLRELGTIEDFEDLVNFSKELGIDIALDIAYQCAPDHPYVKEHPQWFKWRPDGTVQYAENPPKKYQDVLPINFETEDWENLWHELKSVFEFWIEKGVTIFRVDNPHTKSFKFWEWCIAELNAKYDNIIFLSEAFTRRKIMQHLAKIGFTQSYTYFSWRNSKAEMQQYLTELTTTEEREYFRPNFWPNTPDILPKTLQFDGDNMFVIRFALAATLSASYGFYGPAFELMWTHGLDNKEEYYDSEKFEIKVWDWFADTKFKRIIRRVNQIRKENTALQNTFNIQFIETENDKVLGFVKVSDDGKNKILVLINMDSRNTQKTFFKVPLATLEVNAGDRFKITDLMNGFEFWWQDEWHVLDLDPFDIPFRILAINSFGEYVQPPAPEVPELAEYSGS